MQYNVYSIPTLPYLQLCSQKGFICEVCNSDQVIYPFEISETYQVSKEVEYISSLFELLVLSLCISAPVVMPSFTSPANLPPKQAVQSVSDSREEEPTQ